MYLIANEYITRSRQEKVQTTDLMMRMRMRMESHSRSILLSLLLIHLIHLILIPLVAASQQRPA